eukprot:gene7436-10132_t
MFTNGIVSIGSSTHSSIDELLDEFHLAAAQSNLRDYLSCFHQSGTFIGTDATENWNMAQFYEYCEPHFSNKEGWEYIPIQNSRKLVSIALPDNNGDLVISMCTFDELLLSPGLTNTTCRGTGSAIYNKEKNNWLITSYHLSIPIPNEHLINCINTIKKSENKIDANAIAEANAAALIAEIELENSVASNTNSNNKKKANKKKGKSGSK